MPPKILRVTNPMIRKALLPYLNLLHLPQAIGISTLDKLHSSLQRDSVRRREQQMDMVRHNDKLVQQIFPLIAIADYYLNQKPRTSFDAKDWQASPGDRRDEKCTLRIHPRNRKSVKIKSSVTSVTSEKIASEIGNDETTTGAKAHNLCANWRGPGRAALPRSRWRRMPPQNVRARIVL